MTAFLDMLNPETKCKVTGNKATNVIADSLERSARK